MYIDMISVCLINSDWRNTLVLIFNIVHRLLPCPYKGQNPPTTHILMYVLVYMYKWTSVLPSSNVAWGTIYFTSNVHLLFNSFLHLSSCCFLGCTCIAVSSSARLDEKVHSNNSWQHISKLNLPINDMDWWCVSITLQSSGLYDLVIHVPARLPGIPAGLTNYKSIYR